MVNTITHTLQRVGFWFGGGFEAPVVHTKSKCAIISRDHYNGTCSSIITASSCFSICTQSTFPDRCSAPYSCALIKRVPPFRPTVWSTSLIVPRHLSQNSLWLGNVSKIFYPTHHPLARRGFPSIANLAKIRDCSQECRL